MLHDSKSMKHLLATRLLMKKAARVFWPFYATSGIQYFLPCYFWPWHKMVKSGYWHLFAKPAEYSMLSIYLPTLLRVYCDILLAS